MGGGIGASPDVVRAPVVPSFHEQFDGTPHSRHAAFQEGEP